MLDRLRRLATGSSVRSLDRAAAAGDIDAMFDLGCHYSVQSDPPDLHAARHWCERASAAGDRGAMHNLEVLFGDSTKTPRGWGLQPPTDEELDAMVDWMNDSGVVVGEAFENAITAVNEAINSAHRADEAAARAMIRNICRRFIDELPAVLPTPDPELTRVLQGLLDDANEWSWTDRELPDTLTPQQRETLQSRSGELPSRFQVVSSLLERDIGILEAAGRG